MTTTRTPAEMLAVLNSYRVADGKPVFADWRKARHLPMLETYETEYKAKYDAEQAELARKAAALDPDADKAEQVKAPAYKVLARQSGRTSAIEKPVEYVHAFCSEHPEMTRKEAIAALVAAGVNYSTARTQYQKWFAKK